MKRIFLFANLIFFTGLVYAQNTTTTTSKDQPFAQFGIKAGVNVANVKSNLYDNSTSRVGFFAGGLAHIHLSPHIAVQPEITYSQQGFKEHISSNYDVTGKFDYVNIPVLFQYMNSGVRLETGPQLGFLVNSKAEYSDGRTDDIDGKLKSTDFSWDFGVGYLSPYGLGVSARYNLGISNINKDITQAGVTNTDINNRVWQFGLFYQFRR